MISYIFSIYESLYYFLTTKPDVEHFEQLYDWDCGHTCLQMVIQYCDTSHDITQALDDLETLKGPQKPLWTIDLFAYLARHGVKASFYTVCATGIDTHHQNIEWYQSTSLMGDTDRVHALFLQAAREKWPVFEVILP